MAIIFTVSLAAVPHHHHGQFACVVTDVCGECEPSDMEHSDHHDTDNAEHSCNCYIGVGYILARGDNEKHDCISHCDNAGHLHPFPLLYIIYSNIEVDPLGLDSGFGEFITTYNSIDACHIYGLRAPPCFT